MLTVQKTDFGRTLWVKAEVGQYFLQCNDNICVVMTAVHKCTGDFKMNRLKSSLGEVLLIV